MANLLEPLCTCAEFWCGQRERPACVVHEERSEQEEAYER